jgi:hypothetical protein
MNIPILIFFGIFVTRPSVAGNPAANSVPAAEAEQPRERRFPRVGVGQRCDKADRGGEGVTLAVPPQAVIAAPSISCLTADPLRARKRRGGARLTRGLQAQKRNRNGISTRAAPIGTDGASCVWAMSPMKEETA